MNNTLATVDFETYSLKGVKSCNAREGIAWSGTLCRDGKKIAVVQEHGCGGPLSIYWAVKGEEQRLSDHAAKQPPHVGRSGRSLPYNSELFLSALFDWTAALKKARSLLKRDLVVIVPGKEGVSLYKGATYSPDTIRRLPPGVTAVDPGWFDAAERVARALLVD